MNYMIVYGPPDVEFTKKVSQYIEEGWKPTGGLTAIGPTLFQAMVKEEWQEINKS